MVIARASGPRVHRSESWRAGPGDWMGRDRVVKCSDSAGRLECPWSSESERGAWAVLTRRGRDIMVKGQAVVWPSESRQSAGLEPDGGT